MIAEHDQDSKFAWLNEVEADLVAVVLYRPTPFPQVYWREGHLDFDWLQPWFQGLPESFPREPKPEEIRHGWFRWLHPHDPSRGMAITHNQWPGFKPITFWMPEGIPQDEAK